MLELRTRAGQLYPTKARHSGTISTLTPVATFVLVPDTQSLPFVRVHASMDALSRGSSAAVGWLVSHVNGSPEPAPTYVASPTQRQNTKHKLETTKEGSNSPMHVRSTQRMAERDSRRLKDPMQGQKSPTQPQRQCRQPNYRRTLRPWARTQVTAMKHQGVGPPCASSTSLACNSERGMVLRCCSPLLYLLGAILISFTSLACKSELEVYFKLPAILIPPMRNLAMPHGDVN
jgi:hypothetical protein